MGFAFATDDSARPFADVGGLRPIFAGMLTGTMTGSTVDAGTLPVNAPGITGGPRIYQVTATQPILFAIGAAGQAGTFTGFVNMVYVPATWVYVFRADPGDTNFYVQQGGTAGTYQITAMK